MSDLAGLAGIFLERASEREALAQRKLRRHGGNVTQAARTAGMYRSYLHKLLARYRPAAPG